MKRIVRWYKQSPLLKKMTVFAIVMLLLPCLLLSMLVFYLNIRRRMDQEIAQNEAVLRTMSMDIQNQMTNVESVIALMTASPVVRNLLIAPPASDGSMAVTLLYEVKPVIEDNMAYLRDMDASIMLVVLDEHVPEMYGSVMHRQSMIVDESYERFERSGKTSLWGDVGYFMPPGKLNANYYTDLKLPYYAQINMAFHRQLGAVKCSISLSRLFRGLIPWTEQSALMVYQGERLIFLSGDRDFSAPQPIRESIWRERDVLYLPVSIRGSGLTLVMAVDYRAIQWQAMLSVLPLALAVLQAMLIIVFATRRYLGSILGRLRTTVDAMSQINENNTLVQLPNGDMDEVGMLVSAFNGLLLRLSHQHDEILEKERGKQQAQILALQYQMNPHFLFNALHWLQLKAELSGSSEAFSNAIALLGNILHYNLTTIPYATVSMEVSHMEAYAAFVQMWKETTIALVVHCKEEVKQLAIPKFTLQPIVENAVTHGLVPDVALNVEIFITEQDGYLTISVENDGRSVTEEKLNDMQGRVSREGVVHNTQGLGLNNLAQRMYLIYGKDASIDIDRTDKGTPRITLHLPIGLEKGMRTWIS